VNDEAPAPRKRGRPPGSKNRPKELQGLAREIGVTPVAASIDSPIPTLIPSGPVPPPALGSNTTRAQLESDRDRLLKAIADEHADPCEMCGRAGDPKVHAALQSQLNGVTRMMLRITGETAPTDANLIRSPQYLRLKADLLTVLKKHPAALAEVAAAFDTAEH
jgi:hypothetical protein